jgi:hypothetical protein
MKIKLIGITHRQEYQPEGKKYKIITLNCTAQNEAGKQASIILKLFNDNAANSLRMGQEIEVDEQINQRSGQKEYILKKPEQSNYQKPAYKPAGYSKPEPKLNLNQYLLLCDTLYAKAASLNAEQAHVLFEKMLNNCSFWVNQSSVAPKVEEPVKDVFAGVQVDQAIKNLDAVLDDDQDIPF